MKLFKYRPWNDYAAQVIAESKIFFPSKEKLNDPAELIHPIRFESSTWHQEFHLARKTMDPATFAVVDEIHQKFRILNSLLEMGERGVLDDPEYRRYHGERDDFLRVVEATFDRVEVHEALKYFMLAHAEDRANLYATEAEVVDRLNQKLSTLGVLSLARRSDCPVMWSHYAANHTGVVLVFETERDPMLSKARALTYVESRPTMTVANVIDVLYMKAAAWAYEAEYRVLEKNGNQCYGFNEEALVGVIFGMRMSQRERRQVSVAIRQRVHPVLLYEAWSDAANYSICTRPVGGPDHPYQKRANKTLQLPLPGEPSHSDT